MNINSRFKEIINTCYNGNKRAFSMAVGLSTSVVENVVGKRNGNPSYEVLEKICANANINPEWLLTGKGEMLKQPTASGDIIGNKSKIIKDISGRVIVDSDNVNVNPNDFHLLVEIINQKEQYIIKLRRQNEEQHDDFVSKLEAKEMFYNNLLNEKNKIIDEKDINCRILLNEKDKFIEKLIADRDELIKKMMDRENSIVKNSYDRNNENLSRMDRMHEKLFELQTALLSLLNNQ